VSALLENSRRFVSDVSSCEVCGACSALPDYATDGTRRGCLCVACGLLARSLAHVDQRDRVRRAIDYVVWHTGRNRADT
jgi:hypothetical protein